MGIEFKHPILFLLCIPAALLLFYFYYSTKGNKSFEKTLVLLLRSIIFLLMITTLTIPQITATVKDVQVVYLVDRSMSMDGTADEVLGWIDQSVMLKAKDDGFAVLAFGKDAAIEHLYTRDERVNVTLNSEIGTYSTNMENALYVASSLFPNKANGRIVLFSDGNQTEGDIIEAAKLLKSKGIEVDYVPMEGAKGEDLALTSFTVPPAMYQGENASIEMKVTSNQAKGATIRITVNDQEIIRETIHIKEGDNQFSYSHLVPETGLLVYKAEMIAENDHYAENNVLHAISNVEGTPKVLLVRENEADHWSKVLGSNLDVVQMAPELLPEQLSTYLQYGTIIFDNIPATSVGETKMELIKTAVQEFGVGFVMTGGEFSYGLGGYFQTPIEDILPVEMEVKGKEELPSLGLMIVLDRSGSMEGQKFLLAKEAAARSVELLRSHDTLGFIAFDDKPWVVREPTPLQDKEEAIELIRSVPVGGGTEIYPALREAYDKLADLDLKRKHIILLTDGQSATKRDYFSMLEKGLESNITLSTVALGQDADKNLLERLAEAGLGRFYDVRDDSMIPSILSRETAMTTRTYIVDEPFYPKIHEQKDWDFLFKDGVPEMNAYIATTKKQTASVIATSEKDDPIIAEWQAGLGKTLAFTSDTSGKWSGEWKKWAEWPRFLNHLVSRTLPTFHSEEFFMEVDSKNGQTTVQLSFDHQEFSTIEAMVYTDKGEKINSTMEMVAPGKYEVMMSQDPGVYFMQIKQTTETGEEKQFKTGFTIPYTEELLIKGINDTVLNDIASLTSGKEITDEKMVFLPLEHQPVQKYPLAQVLLVVAFLLFFTEIAIRRFGVGRLEKLFLLISKGLRIKRQRTEKTKPRQLKPVQQTKELKIEEQQEDEPGSSRQENLSRLIKAKEKKR